MTKTRFLMCFAGTFLASALTAAGEAKNKPQPKVDGEEAYKAHCTRCHMEVRTYSPGVMTTMLQHMRVRANLNKHEIDAVLRYLLEGEGASRTSISAKARGL